MSSAKAALESDTRVGFSSPFVLFPHDVLLLLTLLNGSILGSADLDQ